MCRLFYFLGRKTLEELEKASVTRSELDLTVRTTLRHKLQFDWLGRQPRRAKNEKTDTSLCGSLKNSIDQKKKSGLWFEFNHVNVSCCAAFAVCYTVYLQCTLKKNRLQTRLPAKASPLPSLVFTHLSFFIHTRRKNTFFNKRKMNARLTLD